MTYKARKISPSVNRRISMAFRESDLKNIFETNLSLTKFYTEACDYQLQKAQNKVADTLQIQSLTLCLEIYLKCLTFDFIAILLNETIEEPSMATVRNQFRIFDHPLMRQQASVLKTSSPSLMRTKSRFFKLSKLQLQQPSIELSPLRAKEEDNLSATNFFDNSFLSY